MKAIKVKELFGLIPNWNWRGQDEAIEHDEELYLPLEVVDAKGYIYRRLWIEEIDINED